MLFIRRWRGEGFIGLFWTLISISSNHEIMMCGEPREQGLKNVISSLFPCCLASSTDCLAHNPGPDEPTNNVARCWGKHSKKQTMSSLDLSELDGWQIALVRIKNQAALASPSLAFRNSYESIRSTNPPYRVALGESESVKLM